MADVVDLIRYPIKGCAGTSMGDALLTPAGLKRDRSFMVISEDGVYRTQRRHPRLALVRPTVSPDGSRPTLDSADTTSGCGTVHLDVTTSAPRRDVDLSGATFQGIDQGDEVAAWLSEFLGTPSRLVRLPPEHDRIADGVTPGPSGYADSSAVHVVPLVPHPPQPADRRARHPAPAHESLPTQHRRRRRLRARPWQ